MAVAADCEERLLTEWRTRRGSRTGEAEELTLRYAEFERLEDLPVEVLSPQGGQVCLALGG